MQPINQTIRHDSVKKHLDKTNEKSAHREYEALQDISQAERDDSSFTAYISKTDINVFQEKKVN